MYQPRQIKTSPDWLDGSGSKIYTISVQALPVNQEPFLARLEQVKATRPRDWSMVPSFAIFHQGATLDYLIFAWWGNDNELFTSVSVRVKGDWLEDRERYSFCLFDMEVFWAERNLFIEHLYGQSPSLERYRMARMSLQHG